VPADAPFLLDDAALIATCRVERCRSHGPGGQHANKTESAVRLTHLASGEQASCQDHRDHGRNLVDATARLRLRLALRLRGLADPAVIARHRRGRQIALGPRSRDYPAAVAAGLDALAAAAGSLPLAAEALGLSSSQLAGLLTADKEARQAANALRAGCGLGALKT